jgi:flagellar biosynthesis/type III secretory pathway protein FliH
MTEEYDKGFKEGFEEGFYANEVLEKNEYDIGFEDGFHSGFKAGLEAAKQSIIELEKK